MQLKAFSDYKKGLEIMSNYIKPTISLVASGTSGGAASSCSTSSADAKEIKNILISMGYDLNTAFNALENCQDPVMLEEYCKFSSSITVFGS